jgi:16S rRNA (guanine527-N7)-methyltransferase
VKYSILETIRKYFTNLNPQQQEQLQKLSSLYNYWNQQINVISRADMEHFYTRHVVHSLGIAKVLPFTPDAKILDVGTGGGFPGIPLAILFPQVQFTLVDSIGKKVKVVQAVAEALSLDNVKPLHQRAEDIPGTFDFVVSRAVTRMERFVPWVEHKICKQQKHALKNGILYLKGGDLTEELKPYPAAKLYPLSSFFEEDFFETKQVVHLAL